MTNRNVICVLFGSESDLDPIVRPLVREIRTLGYKEPPVNRLAVLV